jgi:O-antigen ligase
VTVSEAIFLALIASLPVMRPVLLHVRTYTIPPADFIFILAVLAAIVDVVRGRKSIPRSRIIVWVALYAAALSMSTIMSIDRPLSRIKFAGDLYLFGLAGLALTHVRSLPALRRALLAWTAGVVITVVAAGAGLALFILGVRDPYNGNPFLSIHGSLPDGTYPRVMGLFLNPNMYCAYLVASLAIVVTAYRAGWIPRVTAAILGAGIVVAGAWSLSPGFGGMLIVIACGIRASWQRTRPGLVRAATLASAIGAACFIAAIVASPQPGAALSLHGLRPSSRMLAWIGSMKAFPAHPWFGKGLGVGVVEIRYINPAGEYELLTDAHNTWLSILVQCGVIGLAAFTALTVALWRGSNVRAQGTPYDRVVAGLSVAFVAGFLYQSLSGSFENTRHVWMLIGLLAAAKQIRDEVQASTGREYPGAPAAR